MVAVVDLAAGSSVEERWCAAAGQLMCILVACQSAGSSRLTGCSQKA